MFLSSSKKTQTKTVKHHIDGLYTRLKTGFRDPGSRQQINKVSGALSILLILGAALVGILQGLAGASAGGDKVANLYATICNGDPKNTVLTADASAVNDASGTQVKSKFLPERNFASLGQTGTAVYKEGSELACEGPRNTSTVLTSEIKSANQFRFAKIKFSLNKIKASEVRRELATQAKSQTPKPTYFERMDKLLQDSSIGDKDISAAWTARASIWWTLDGEEWQELTKLEETDQDPFIYEAPFLRDWNDLDDLQIKFKGALKDQNYTYQGFDDLWVEVTYREPEEILELQTPKEVWKATETPEFNISTETQKGFLGNFGTQVAQIVRKPRLIEVKLTEPSGETVLLDEGKDFLFKTKPSRNLKILKPPDLKPGAYRLDVIYSENGKILHLEQEFRWGVLAINTNRSIYLPGESAYLQMAALDDEGHTICDANLELEVENQKVEVQRSGECLGDNVTDVPDYFAYYKVGLAGKYKMKLKNLDNGYEIIDSFEVKEKVPFEVERIGATRINPFLANYSMTLKIKANENYKGEIIESVPKSFKIIDLKGGKVRSRTDRKEIVWKKSLKEGDELKLNYVYDAPNISPELYLLGPLTINDFKEARQWQIAADVITVQNDADDNVCKNSSTCSVTLNVPGTASMVVVAVGVRNGETITSITDGDGDPYFVAYSQGTGPTAAIYYNVDPFITTNASKTITANLSASTADTFIDAYTLTETETSSPIDATATGSGSTGNLTANITTNNDNSLIAFMGMGQDNVAYNSYGAGQEERGQGGSSAGGVKFSGVNSSEITTSAGNNLQTVTPAKNLTWRTVAVEIKVAPPTIDISGTAHLESATIKVAVNGSVQAQSTTTGSSCAPSCPFTITGVAEPGTGEPVTVWIDGVADSNESTAVTLYAGGDTDITGFELDQNILAIGTNSAYAEQSLSVTNVGHYDCQQDEDIMHNEESSELDVEEADLGVCAGVTQNSYTDETIRIEEGDTLTIGGTEILDTHNLTVDDAGGGTDGTLTSGGSSSYVVSGSWDNNAVFTASTSTVTFNASSTIETIDSTGAATATFNNVLINDSLGSATFRPVSTLDINDTFSLLDGIFDLDTNDPDVNTAGDVIIGFGASVNKGSGTWTFDPTGTKTLTDSTSPSQDLGAVAISGGASTPQLNLGSSISATSINVAAAHTLNVNGSNTITLTGTSGSPLTLSGDNFTESTGTVVFNGNGAITIAATTYNNLTFSPLLSASGKTYTGGGAITVSGALDINPDAASSLALTFDLGGTTSVTGATTIRRQNSATSELDTTASDHSFTTGSLTIDADGTLTGNASALDSNGNISIAASGALSSTSGTFNMGGDYVNLGGTFTHNSGSVLFDSSSTGKTIISGGTGIGKDFYDIEFNNSAGGWSISVNNLTATNNFTITDTAAIGFTVNSVVVEVNETYSIADAETANTTWSAATLYLNSTSAYTVGSKNQSVEIYATLQIGASTDIRIWQSTALTFSVDASGSLYSQDHVNIDGDLYIWGDYHTDGTDYWNYADDFDGAAAANRQVDVRIDGSANITVDAGETLESVGTAVNRTTVSNQGSGGYGISVATGSPGGTIDFQYTDFDYLEGTTGLNIATGAVVTSLDNTAFDNMVNSGTDAFITVAYQVIGSGTKTISNVSILNNGGGANCNVNRTAGTDTGYWDFDNHNVGGFAGEDYDCVAGVNEDDPGMLRWDDSITNQDPNDPSALVQKKTDDSVLDTGDWTDETSVKYTATVTDPDTDQVRLCVEKDNLATGFSDTEDLCGDLVNSGQTATVTITSQTDDTQYHWQARAKDDGDAYSNWVSYGGNGEGERDYGIDTSAPTGGTVYDGDGIGVDIDWNDSSLTQMHANWESFDASVSGFDKYQYGFRRKSDDWWWNTASGWQSGSCWIDHGSTSVTLNNLDLNTSNNYYFTVRAWDNAGNDGSPVNSDGQRVLPTLGFSLNTTSITFDNLNPDNNHWDRKTSTVTTSTNAYSGYSVYASITQLLTSSDYPSHTIPNFADGSYESPAAWPDIQCTGTDCGFGYTSNDMTIGAGKVNKFLNGTLYAPFSMTPPGDVVADWVDNIDGQPDGPLVDDDYIITYKVATLATQGATTYYNKVTYIVTAIY